MEFLTPSTQGLMPGIRCPVSPPCQSLTSKADKTYLDMITHSLGIDVIRWNLIFHQPPPFNELLKIPGKNQITE